MHERFNLARFNLPSQSSVMRNMIFTFNDHPLSDFVPYAQILDIRVGSPDIENTTIRPGISSGSIFVRNRLIHRKIELDIELPLDKKMYAANASRLRQWTYSEEPKDITIKGIRNKTIKGICTGISEISLRDYWKFLTVQFGCYDPYFYSVEPKTEQVNSQFSIQGDAPARLYVDYSLGSSTELTAPEWIIDSSERLKLTSNVTGGNLNIDMEKQCITRSGESLMANLSLLSRFPDFEPGTHTITGPSGGTITWYERWL